jgi:hypothetical protein
MGDVGGEELMADRESREKSEIRYTIINVAENGDERKCARRTGMATAPWYSSPLSHNNAAKVTRARKKTVFSKLGSAPRRRTTQGQQDERHRAVIVKQGTLGKGIAFAITKN